LMQAQTTGSRAGAPLGPRGRFSGQTRTRGPRPAVVRGDTSRTRAPPAPKPSNTPSRTDTGIPTAGKCFKKGAPPPTISSQSACGGGGDGGAFFGGSTMNPQIPRPPAIFLGGRRGARSVQGGSLARKGSKNTDNRPGRVHPKAGSSTHKHGLLRGEQINPASFRQPKGNQEWFTGGKPHLHEHDFARSVRGQGRRRPLPVGARRPPIENGRRIMRGPKKKGARLRKKHGGCRVAFGGRPHPKGGGGTVSPQRPSSPMWRNARPRPPGGGYCSAKGTAPTFPVRRGGDPAAGATLGAVRRGGRIALGPKPGVAFRGGPVLPWPKRQKFAGRRTFRGGRGLFPADPAARAKITFHRSQRRGGTRFYGGPTGAGGSAGSASGEDRCFFQNIKAFTHGPA